MSTKYFIQEIRSSSQYLIALIKKLEKPISESTFKSSPSQYLHLPDFPLTGITEERLKDLLLSTKERDKSVKALIRLYYFNLKSWKSQNFLLRRSLGQRIQREEKNQKWLEEGQVISKKGLEKKDNNNNKDNRIRRKNCQEFLLDRRLIEKYLTLPRQEGTPK